MRYIYLEQISKTERKINAIKSKYKVGKPNGVLESYSRLPFFKIHRFFLEADGRVIYYGDEGRCFLKMQDVGLYFYLNMIATENGVDSFSRVQLFNSDEIRNSIKDLLSKSSGDSRASKTIRDSFMRLKAAELIECDIDNSTSIESYHNIKIPHKHNTYKTKGFFRFYYVDIQKAIEKIKDGVIDLSTRDFLNLLGVYTVSSLIFYNEHGSNYLGNGIVTVDSFSVSRYANRIDFTFGLKLTGGVRKKGVKEYMDILEELGLMVSMGVNSKMYENRFTLYTFPKNIGQFYKIIEDIYEQMGEE